MTNGKNDKWLGWLALSTAIMAVLAAVTTLYVGKYSSRAVLFQGQESNQWAYFQAKSIKQHTYEIEKERLELELLAGGGRLAKAAEEKYRATAEGYGGEVVRYEKGKAKGT